jgi:hypothetical protein
VITPTLARIALAAALAASAAAVLDAADPLSISPNRNPVMPGETVTFTFSPPVVFSGDAITFNFGDGTESTVSYSVGCAIIGGCVEVTHAYAGPGEFTIRGEGTARGVAVVGSTTVTVSAAPPDQGRYILTAAHLPGFGGTLWRTDLEVHNPGTVTASYIIELLARNQPNPDPPRATFTLSEGRSATYADILHSVFSFSGAAALRITPIQGDVLLASRTFNQTANGTYGQFVPAHTVSQAIVSGKAGRLIQLSHDPSLATGFRTNIGFVSASVVPIDVEIRFATAIGRHLGTHAFQLKPYEFKQFDKAFELVTREVVNGGYATVRTTTTGGAFFAYASVVDNRTGDPVFVPAALLP